MQHPAFQEMLQLGCSDRLKVMTAFQGYMKLCEVDKLRDVQFLYNKELDLIYLLSTDKDSAVEVHVPVGCQQPVSPAWLQLASSSLRSSHPHATVNFSLKTPDSSLLPYRVTEGLLPPLTPEATKEKKALQEKLQYVQSELCKRKPELLEKAKRRRMEEIKSVISDTGKSEELSVKDEPNHNVENVIKVDLI